MQSSAESSSSHENTSGYTNQFEQRENKPPTLNQQEFEELRLTEFATQLAELLCSQKKLIQQLNSTENKNLREEIAMQINELKNEIANLEAKIKSEYLHGDSLTEINKQAEMLANDC